MTAADLDQAPSCKFRLSIHFAVSVIIGFACDILLNMRMAGFVSPWTAGIAVCFALLWVIGVYVIDWMWRGGKSAVRSLGACAGVIALSWILGALVFPDAAVAYFWLRRGFIEEHWRVDPATGLTYYPIDYGTADEGGQTVPWVFYIWDKTYRLSVDPLTHDLVRPSCPDDVYAVKQLRAQIYVLRQFHESLASHLTPCLITPTSKDRDPF